MDENKFSELLKLHKNIQAVLSIMSRDDNKNWKCPVCKSPLYIVGQREYETLCEHVSDPNMESYPLRDVYECSNENCASREQEVFWSYEGGRYGGLWKFENCCIGQNDGPFGSNERKNNVEIYRKGLKTKTYLHPALCLWFFQPMLEYQYTSDLDGNVLRKRTKIKFLKKDGNPDYCIVVIPFWEMWSFLQRETRQKIKHFKKSPIDKNFKRIFEKSLNRSWVFRLHEWYVKNVMYWFIF